MPDSNAPTCPSCGARLDPGDEVCDLCGTAVEPQDTTAQSASSGGASSPQEGPYCNQCGWQNPVDANFCSKCGTRLQDVSASSSAQHAKTTPATSPPETVAKEAGANQTEAEADDTYNGRRKQMVGILVGASVLVVVALFLMLAYGRQESGANGGAQQAGRSMQQGPRAQSSAMPRAQPDSQSSLKAEDRDPLTAPFAGRVDSIKDVIAQAAPAEKKKQRQKLVDLYVGAGRADLAALKEREVAREADTPEAWTKAGDRFYEWMMNASGNEKAKVAAGAADAYKRVLKKQPDNHDVRTRLGWAYLQTRMNPMRGIQQIKRVIEEDPDHVPARMNYGIALAQIGRFDKAIEQFKHVKDISDKNTSSYQQADRIIKNLRKQRGKRGQPQPKG